MTELWFCLDCHVGAGYMSKPDLIDEITERHCPSHNEIDENESHFHCEECAGVIKERFKLALQELAQRMEAFR